MLFTSDDERLNRAHYWVEQWARRMRRDKEEILSEVGYPPATVIGVMSPSNYAVSEDDKEAYYERHEARQVDVVDAAITDLRVTVPWAAWAICRKHRLGNMGMTQYDFMLKGKGPGAAMAPGLYASALEELSYLLDQKGLV